MPDTQDATTTKQSQAWRWWIAVVLFLATMLTYLDRQTISICGPMISDEFRLSNEQFGQLLAAFRWTYALAQIGAGYLADRFSVRLVYALAVGLWSAAGAAGAFIRSSGQLLVTRAVLGVGESFNWPCANRVVARLHVAEDRSLASGIFNSGAAVGSLLSPLVITPIAIAYGWRWAFFLIGALGPFWIALWTFNTRRGTHFFSEFHSTQSRPYPGEANGAQHGSAAAWTRAMLRHPAFWMLFLIGTTINPCWYFLNEWIPKYMHDQRSMGYLAAGLVTVPIFLGADLGNLLSGGVIKFLTMRGWTLRKARACTLASTTALILPVALVTPTRKHVRHHRSAGPGRPGDHRDPGQFGCLPAGLFPWPRGHRHRDQRHVNECGGGPCEPADRPLY